MKIFVFSDNHGNFNIINKIKNSDAELFVCLGDFTIFGSKQKRMLKEFNSLGKKIILIHGNHESWTEIKEDLYGLDNIIFLYRSCYRYKNILFAGYGGGGFSYKEKNFKILNKCVEKEFKRNDKIILLTHGPPYNCKLDLIDDIHIGCINYSDFIKSFKPIYAFSGHIHENAGIKDIIYNCILINPGKNGIEVIV
jgi:uncharacterized protein